MTSAATASPFHELARLGFSAFPVERGGKRPLVRWERFQSERPDPATLEQWAQRETNIGIATGAVSGLLVLDLDSEAAVAEAMALGLPDTLTVRTGKGLHAYFAHPGGKVGNRAGIRPGWDIRGDGGYVVAAGSLHPSGKRYEWGNPPGLFGLAPVPNWLASMLEPPAKPAPVPSVASARPVASVPTSSDCHPYALAALEGECAAICKASQGAQESTLNAAALKMGHYVGGGVLAFDTARNRLLSAALSMPSHDPRNPWTAEGLSAKIDRALRDGMAQPKKVPERMNFASQPRHDPETGEIIEDAPPQPQREGRPANVFRFVAVGDLEYRPPEFLVDGLVETETVGLLFGDPGCGKSFVAVDLCLSIATGSPFHGRKVKRGPVFLIAGEGHNGLTRRFAAWSKSKGVGLDDARLFVSNRSAQFLDAASAASVAEAVHGLASLHGNPALIVIDTLARNFGPGDENSTSDMNAFVNAADDLKAHFPGSAVLIVHHSGHADKQRARGAMSLKGALDCEYRVEKSEGVIRLTNTKMKDAEPPKPLAFKLSGVDLGDGASSAVLVETEAVAQAKGLTAAQMMARDTYIAAGREAGIWDARGFAGLHIDEWRTHFYAKHTGENIDAKRQAFNRVRQALQSADAVKVDNDVYLWNDPAVIALIGARLAA
jgi:hypothetical protein